jgi:flagellar assembly factor FliW
MKVQTKWFGDMEISEDKIFTFEKGIIGFEDFKSFTIVFDAEKEDKTSIYWLQSTEEAALAIPMIDPRNVKEDYDPIVEDELVNTLGQNIQDAQLEVLTTITVPEDLKKMTCNLKAPIILNTDTMKGIQVIADNDDYLVRFPIYDILENKRKDGE